MDIVSLFVLPSVKVLCPFSLCLTYCEHVFCKCHWEQGRPNGYTMPACFSPFPHHQQYIARDSVFSHCRAGRKGEGVHEALFLKKIGAALLVKGWRASCRSSHHLRTKASSSAVG